jgi:hypothetical protein
MSLPHLILAAGEGYLALGVAFALVFVSWLVQRVEPSANGGSIVFRIMIVPGTTLLWPYVALRCVRALRRRSP